MANENDPNKSRISLADALGICHEASIRWREHYADRDTPNAGAFVGNHEPEFICGGELEPEVRDYIQRVIQPIVNECRRGPFVTD